MTKNAVMRRIIELRRLKEKPYLSELIPMFAEVNSKAKLRRAILGIYDEKFRYIGVDE